MLATAATLALHTIGECRITLAHAGRTHTLTPASERLFTLALLLAAQPGRPLPRARTAAWLWPALPPAEARHALRQLAYRLRQLSLPVDGDDAHLWVPAANVASSDPALTELTPGSARCLPDWSPAGPALAAWVDHFRDRTEAALRDHLARALQAAPASAVAQHRLAAALRELDPYHPLARAVRRPPRRRRAVAAALA